MPEHMFGLVDLVVLCGIALAFIVWVMAEIPDLVRYLKIRAM